LEESRGAVCCDRLGSDRAGGGAIALAVGPGASQGLEAALAQAPRVRNALPQGANWDGIEDQYAGEPEFKKPTVTGEGEKPTASR